MVEVFKTNVRTKAQAKEVEKLLKSRLGIQTVNFDLDDCDKILRLEAPTIIQHYVIKLLAEEKVFCEMLPE